MNTSELLSLVQQVQEQYGVLFAQIITINFAMILAIFYVLASHKPAIPRRGVCLPPRRDVDQG